MDIARLHRFPSAVLGAAAGLGGLVTLLGWGLEIRRLTDWFDLDISMLPNAALAALLAGSALLALALGYRRVAAGLAVPVLLIGAAVLLQHITGVDLHIDRLLLHREWGQNATYAPGRIGVPASISFTVLGATLLLATLRRSSGRSTLLGGVLVSAIAILSIIGYLFLADTLYSLPRLTTIALQTAIIVLALGMGVIASAGTGVLAFLREDTAAATLVRRTLPFIILLPVLLGWLILRGLKLEWFDPAFGTSVLVLGLIGLLTIVLWRAAMSVTSHERSLRRLTADLRDADRSKDEFLASLAHELRNPLAPMRTALEVMQRADGRDDLMTASRATMGRQLRQMTRLIDDLLDVNRITRSKLELRLEQVDLAAAVHQAVEASRPVADGADVRLHIQLPDDPTHLHADPARLSQIFSNLLNNACKYNERGGNVWLTAARQGAEVVVSVRDDGIGIAPDMLPRIFDMFFQIGSTPERAHGGLGIGLTLVQRLVDMHGGSVTVHSEGAGKGSEFVLRLPLSDQVAVPQPVTPQLPPVVSGRRRILVVDDNVDTASSLALLLTVMGNETTLGHDGDAAVALAAAFKPEVIFLDIGLPGRNGYEACRAIRQQPGGADITIVAITGWGQARDRVTSRDAGFDAHLVKPVDMAALVAVLASAAKTA